MGKVRVTGSNAKDGSFFKWSDAAPGATLEGQWVGTREGKYGTLGEIKTSAGTITTFPMVWDLQDKLRKVEVGGEVTIVYIGKKHNPKTERSVHLFDVETDEESYLADVDDEDRALPI
jgi:hypothetical protein